MERAGRLIPKLKLSAALNDPESRAMAAWKLAAGEKIARHTRAASLVRGALVIEVEDYTWQRTVAGFEKFLLINLRAALGDESVTSLDFRPMRKPMNVAEPEIQIARRGPARAESARASGDLVADPFLDQNYRQSKR
jgi:predicted nucleic acid-binding Zn ribbon protein